jgi:hypothetical protein
MLDNHSQRKHEQRIREIEYHHQERMRELQIQEDRMRQDAGAPIVRDIPF